MLQFTTNKIANYTAAANELVRADCSDGSFTVTLPASPSANDQVGVFLRDTNTGTNSNTVTVAANSGQTIFGEGSSLKLFVEGDYVEFQFQGATDGWVIIEDRRQSHVGILVASSATAQEYPNNTFTEINFVSAIFDNAGLASTAGNSFAIRRPGRYQMNVRVSLDDQQTSVWTVVVRKNGTDASLFRPSVTEFGPRETFSDILDLAEDDELTVHVRTDGNVGEHHEPSIDDDSRPRFSIAEIR